tara:strand:+ start:35141 stop:37996 length:2856 start_codon:yes stop_codon:yes gene_type:complete
MSGDFFSDIARWWREGVDAAAATPSAGPSVGRGLFSNWFLTERDREIEELVELHARIKAMHLATALAEPGARSDAVSKVVREAFGQSEISFQSDLLSTLYDALAELITEEFIWFPDYEEGSIARLEMKVRSELREFLLRKERFYVDFETRYALGLKILSELATQLLDAIAGEGLDEPGEDEHALQLSMSMASIVDDVPAAIDGVINTFCNDAGAAWKGELFIFLRLQLMRNLCVASGINPDGPITAKPYVLARDAKPAPPGDLVETYLQYTPLQAVFEGSIPIAISDAVRAEHALIVGGSGHGKSQLLLHLIHHDLIHEGDTPPGIIVIDSQGDLIHTISRLALFDPDQAASLADRLVLIDPADIEFPVALNLFAFDQSRLEGYGRADRERVLNSVIDLYEYFFSTLLGAELTQKQGVVFRYLARLMLAIPDATVQTLRELMEDGKPFRPYMKALDGSAKRFFEREFFSPGFAATKKQILRRLWGVLANPVFERMFSHPENRIDLFAAMNEGKIILINTAKDLLKAEGCSIFGRFFIAKIAQAALERATIPEGERRSTYVYIDEAHDYFDDTLEQLFNQARKYRVGLHIAAQHLEQMPVRLRSTVMASTSLKFAGGVSAKDARALADDMRTDADFLRSMRKRRGRSEFAAFVKNRTASALRINVELGQVNALPTLDDDQFQALIDRNRARYCATIDEVEAIISAGDRGDADTAEPIEDPKPPTRPHGGGGQSQPVELPSAPIRPEQDDVPPVDLPAPEQTATEDVQVTRKGEIDRYVAGVGGRQHTQLQQLVRKLAQERGFKATVEFSVLDGAGSVDVALEHEELKIAVEISNTTDIAHELKNVEKCFKAGFDEVFLIVLAPEKRASCRHQIAAALDPEVEFRFFVLGPDEIAPALDERAASLSASKSTVRGWRVTTSYKAVSADEARSKRELIAKIVTQSGIGETRQDPD